jgi:hypothetical protein
MGNLVHRFTDALKVGTEAGQLAEDTQTKLSNASIFELPSIFGNALPNVVTLGAALAIDVAAMTAQVPIVTAQIPICATNASGRAFGRLNTIPANVQRCIQSG